eukprot:COSAG01_NODE_2205_length_8172_cov_35.082126_1_plen_111_part_00
MYTERIGSIVTVIQEEFKGILFCCGGGSVDDSKVLLVEESYDESQPRRPDLYMVVVCAPIEVCEALRHQFPLEMGWPIASQSRKKRAKDGQMRRVGARFLSWPSAGQASM